MAASAKLRGVLTLDNSPFVKGIKQSIAFSKAAAKQFARQPFRTTAIIAGMAGGAGVKGIAKGLEAVGNVGLAAFKIVGVGALAAGAAIAFGTKKAFDLGGEMIDLSARTGISAGRLLILQSALKDAGVEAEETGGLINKMQKFLGAVADGTPEATATLDKLGLSVATLQSMSPDAQFEAIGAAIGKLGDQTQKADAAMKIFGKSGGKLLSFFSDGGALKGAADVVGKQAGLLQKNVVIFDKVSDQLGHVGVKLQGFFIGIADRVAGTISPMLDKLDKIDLAGIGQQFGDGIIKGITFLVGSIKKPKVLLASMGEALIGSGLRLANIVVNGMTLGGQYLKAAIASTEPLFEAIGSSLKDYVVSAMETGVVTLMAGMIDATAALKAGIIVAMSNWKETSLQTVSLFNNKWVQAMLNPVGFLSGKLADIALDFGKAILSAIKGDVLGTLQAASSLTSVSGMMGAAINAMQQGAGVKPGATFSDEFTKQRKELSAGGIGNFMTGLNVDSFMRLQNASSRWSSALEKSSDELDNASNKISRSDINADRFGASAHEAAAGRGFAYVSATGKAAMMAPAGREVLKGYYTDSGFFPANAASIAAFPNVSTSYGRLTNAALGTFIGGGTDPLSKVNGGYGLIRAGDAARAKAEASKAKDPVVEAVEKQTTALSGKIDRPAYLDS